MLKAAVVVLLGALSCMPALAAVQTETIILIRHGEKPQHGLGQLSCKGLNRALKLPGVIERNFGKPDAIFAPNPARLKKDQGKPYAYVRPLATVEPTAIHYALPVDTRFGYDEIDGLKDALMQPDYHDRTVLVAWEHKQLVRLVRQLLKDNNGDKNVAPKWPHDDFDGIFVVKIERNNGQKMASFERLSQNLNGLSEACPQ